MGAKATSHTTHISLRCSSLTIPLMGKRHATNTQQQTHN